MASNTSKPLTGTAPKKNNPPRGTTPAGSYLTNKQTKKNQLDSAFDHLKKKGK